MDGVSSADGLVKGISFRMRSGEVVAIHGDNASSLGAIADICLGSPLSQGSIRVKDSMHALTGPSWTSFEDVIIVTDASRAALHEVADTMHAETLAGLASSGAAILVLSCDFPALAACADRLLVMRDGRLTEEMGRYELSRFSASESLF
jgi:ABC-type sugar transport system ATPase subunit